ncbi:MAG: hypothetical protein ACWGMZ_09280, partial [Thermoguttaceae bacterium]
MYASLMLMAFIFTGAPNDPGTAELNEQVQQLVQQLDADQLARRNAAERELIALGPAVLDLLPSAAQSASAELNARLARIRKKLQQRQAASVLEPSLITLRSPHPLPLSQRERGGIVGQPLRKILASIEQQSGNQIRD